MTGVAQTLTAALDVLVPGDSDFPAAGGLGLAADLLAHDRFGTTSRELAAALPEGFAGLDAAARTAALRALEAAQPALFGAAIVGVYSLYYTRPEVAAVIERVSGYAARPPQPQGHDLAPFDPALVAVPAARAPRYRPTPTDTEAPHGS